MKCENCKNNRPLFLFRMKEKIMNIEVTYPLCEDCEETVIDDKDWRRKTITRIINENSDLKNKHKIDRSKCTKYNMTIGDLLVMKESQKGKCKICNKSEEELNEALYIDHCHISGKVRHLLCRFCNSALGFAKDDPTIIQNMLNYINEYRKTTEYKDNIKSKSINIDKPFQVF